MIAIIRIFIFWRIGLFLVTYLGTRVFPLLPNKGIGAIGEGKNFDFWTSWAQWDGGNFFRIAQEGYQKNQDSVFFPFYPILIKYLSPIFGGNFLISGLLISNVFFLAFLLVFFALVKKKFNPHFAFDCVITFILFPTTFFAVSYYSESTFLLLTAVTFLLLEKNKFIASILAIFLASLTRITGLFLLFSYLFKIAASTKNTVFKISLVAVAALACFIALGSYSIYLNFRLLDPLGYITSQIYWERTIVDPISTMLSYIWTLLTTGTKPWNDYFDFGVTVAFIFLLAIGRKIIPSSWWVFSLLTIIIPMSSSTLTSMPRYVLASFGSFVILVKILSQNRNLKILVWAIFLASQVVLASLFVSGDWVA